MKQRYFAAEAVLPGHPDKICDAIVDALVAEASGRETRALCGLEAAVHRGRVLVTGRIACRGAETIDVDGVVRAVFRSAGYGGVWGPAPEELRVDTELCLGELSESEAAFREFSDDQSIVTGYAVDSPETNYLPLEHWLARRCAVRLERLRAEHPELRLGPDGKVVLVLDEPDGRVVECSVSLQQAIGGDEIGLHRAVRGALSDVLAESAGVDGAVPASLRVNGAGNFEVGGTEGDNGLSGKKLVVDAYGPRVPIGGGALSGKDFFKVDRAGALLARRVAKTIVQCGVARECVSTLAIFPGETAFRIVSLAAEGGAFDPGRWAGMFDLSLRTAGELYGRAADLVRLARYGHFAEPSYAWEVVRI